MRTNWCIKVGDNSEEHVEIRTEAREVAIWG